MFFMNKILNYSSQCSGTFSFHGDKIHFFPSGKLIWIRTYVLHIWLFFIDNGRIGRKKSLVQPSPCSMHVVVLIRRVEVCTSTQCWQLCYSTGNSRFKEQKIILHSKTIFSFLICHVWCIPKHAKNLIA